MSFVPPRPRVRPPHPHFLQAGGRAVVPVGSHYVPPSGPDWPWRVGAADFDAAFAAMAAEGMTAVRIDMLWAAMEPERGVFDEDHFDVLDAILDAARAHGLWIHPTFFIGGEVGDASWDLPWAPGVNPHTDPDLLDAQVAHVRAIGARWAERDEIIAWDLTDEPPYWIHAPGTTDEDARVWTRRLAEALREVDPNHLVTVGTASQDVGWGPFRADVVAPWLDFTCVHPYPIFDPVGFPESILGRRMTHAAAFETALAAGAGRPVMVHEFGASSTQFAPERIAAYDRLVTWSSLGRGAIGFFSWCWGDAEPAAYARAPYVRSPHETQFGAHAWDGTPRPRARELTELAGALAEIDLDAYAGWGPVTGVAVPVPHEYVRPYDSAAYGLDDAPAGPYVPTEPVWRPERDAGPLVRSWLGAFLLAGRAGAAVAYPRKRLDGDWAAMLEGHRAALLPAPLSTCATSLHGLRPHAWGRLADWVRAGGVLYLSCSADTAIPDLADLAGVRIVDRLPADPPAAMRFVAGLGAIPAGTVLDLPAFDATDLARRGVLLEATTAQVVAVDAAGHPLLTRHHLGAGTVLLLAAPVETLLSGLPDDAFGGDAWRLYRAVIDLAGAALPARADHPDLTNGVLRGPAGGLLVVTNHTGSRVEAPLVLPAGVRAVRVVSPGAARAGGCRGAPAVRRARPDLGRPRRRRARWHRRCAGRRPGGTAMTRPPRPGRTDPVIPTVGPILVVDIGGTWTRVGVCEGPTCTELTRFRTEAGDRDRVAEALAEAVHHRPLDVVAVGVSATGPVDPATGRLFRPPNTDGGLAGLDLAGLLRGETCLPVRVERDTNCAVLAEVAYGAAVGDADVVYATFSTGVGAGVLAGGQLLTGRDGVAGELGHLVVDPSGPPCGCGRRGCLEALASGPAVAAAAAGADGAAASAAAAAGDARAVAALARAEAAVASACVDWVNAFNPARIIIGGSVAQAHPEWLSTASTAVATLAMDPARERCTVVAAALGEAAPLVGAALLWTPQEPRR